MSGGGSQTTTQSSTPWAGQQPYLEDVFQQSQDLYNQGPQQYYQGNQVAPFSPQTGQAFDMMTQQAMQGSPVTGSFGNYLTGAMNQPGMDPNRVNDPASQAAGGIPTAQNMMMGANDFAGGARGPYAPQWAGAMDYRGLGEAQNYAGSPGMGALPASQQFVEQTLGGMRPDLQGAMGAASGSLDPAALAQLRGTAGGQFLGSNPYLDSVYDQAASRLNENFQENIMPGVAGQFGAAGRTGSGAHALMAGRAAGEQADALGQLGASIYAPAYEAERGRQVQSASQLGQLGLGAGGIGSDIYGTELGHTLGAGQLGGDIFSRMNEADTARRGMGADLYLGERGLAQQGMAGGSSADQAYRNMMLNTGTQLGNLGMGGIDALSGMYGNMDTSRFRAGSLAPTYDPMRYSDADRMWGVGSAIEDQSQRMIDANMNQWNFGQQAPWQNLGNYANAVYGLPSGYGTQSSTGPGPNRLAGALGGGMTGYQMGGPWGAAGGAILGGLL